MNKIIHRYLLKDLVKSFLLATAALTLILSLGGLIAPAREYGVSPAQAVRLIIYFIPVTLAFVLPVGAVFAAAVTYGRFAGQNEYNACRAGGISTTSIMLPAVYLGLFVMALNLLLNFYVVPHYIHKAEVNVKANIKQIVFRSIKRKGMYEIEDKDSKTFIIADKVDEEKNILSGVNILRVQDGSADSLITSSLAKVNFSKTDKGNEISVTAYELFQADKSGYSYCAKLPLTTKVGSLIVDNIRFKKLSMLREIEKKPVLFGPVREKADQLIERISTELLAQKTAESAEDDSWIELEGISERLLFRAESCRLDSDLSLEAEGVEVLEYSKGAEVPQNRWKAESAELYAAGSSPEDYWNFSLKSVSPAEGTSSQAVESRTFRHLETPSVIEEIYSSQDSLSAALDSGLVNPSIDVKMLKEELNQRIDETAGEVAIEINYRLVFGIACLFITITGAAFGVIMRSSHVLASFGAGIIPLAVLVVFIMMGKNLTKNIISHTDRSGDSGIVLIWAGLGVVMLIMAFAQRNIHKT
ncbi:lipopolysaccharide ABC transporter permease [Sedimentisphaera cyanobacteriorum]|uniref:Lipopolysaccharide ABC transporter permease n=1 Tax=Sedimentisphaera cyanobacteriorum TaxID=1940790 RepID=A0A1Q2HSB7_9BACT|nr:LptF/LptG family permease [Sedimentisphaera cyanobacteriorum]AQQ10221.1 lipopolysaccharide ABC transporter permease [Sedimentisphaera cyanobacteriorum]